MDLYHIPTTLRYYLCFEAYITFMLLLFLELLTLQGIDQLCAVEYMH